MSSQVAAWIDAGVFVLVLIPIVLSDIRDHRVPDRWVVLGGLLLLLRRLIVSLHLGLWSLLFAAMGFVFIWIVWYVSRGKIGLGDAKLSGLIALFLGLSGWILALLLASLAGLAWAGIRIGRGEMTKKDRIPFAPFLGAGAGAAFTAGLLWEEVGFSAL